MAAGLSIHERTERIAGMTAMVVALPLLIALTVLSARTVPVLLVGVVTLASHVLVFNKLRARLPAHASLIEVGRDAWVAATLALLVWWAGKGCPGWLWAVPSIAAPFLGRSSLVTPVVTTIVNIAVALGTTWYLGTQPVDLLVPLMVLLSFAIVGATSMRLLRTEFLRTAEISADAELRGRALDFAGDAVELTDDEHRLIYVNPAWEKLTGIAAEDAFGQTPAQLLRSDRHSQSFYEDMEATIASGEVYQGTLFSRVKCGAEIETAVTVAPVLGSDGNPRAYLSIRRDLKEQREMISALERARDQARAANQAKNVFLANVSHEIRTPMNGVVGMASMLGQTRLSSDQHSYVETIRSSAEALLDVIQRVLDFSAIEAGRLELVIQPFDLHELAHSVARLASGASPGVDVRVEIGAKVSRWVRGDVNRVRQVLTNFLANALKFTTEGEVLLEISDQGEQTRLSVSDTGVGIPPDRQAAIFEPFEQVGDLASRGRGTGLGLAICRHLIHAMGSKIELESSVGVGSTFSFVVDLPPARAPSRAPIATPQELPRGARILVVDDDQINRTVAAVMLEKLGQVVITAVDGSEAAELATGERFDLILMDCQMPVMNGFESTRSIRSNGLNTKTSILGLTADARAEHFDECKVAGMDDVITKPVTVSDLSVALGRWIRGAP